MSVTVGSKFEEMQKVWDPVAYRAPNKRMFG